MTYYDEVKNFKYKFDVLLQQGMRSFVPGKQPGGVHTGKVEASFLLTTYA